MKNNILNLLFVILFTIVSTNSFAQTAPPVKIQEKTYSSTEIRTPTAEELNKQARALTPEAKKKSESVINDAKKLGRNSDVMLVFYTLQNTNETLNQKFQTLKNLNPNSTKSDILNLLNSLRDNCKNALLEVEKFSKAEFNYSADDRTQIENYRSQYTSLIEKFNAQILIEQNR